MTTEHALRLRVKVSTSRACRLAERIASLQERATANTAPRVAEQQAADPGGEFNAILERVKSIGLSTMGGALNGEGNFSRLHEVSHAVKDLADKVDGLPDELRERSSTKLEELGQEIADKIDEMIEMVHSAFIETEQKVTNAIEETEERIAELADDAYRLIRSALEELQQSLDQSRRSVDSIVSTLDRTRRTVLTACRTAGVGASAAEPVVDVAVSAFSAIN